MKEINAAIMRITPIGDRMIVITSRKPKMPSIIEPTTVPGLNYSSLIRKIAFTS
jgi:hypothetical protein